LWNCAFHWYFVISIFNHQLHQGSELLSGQQALSALSNNGLCAMYLLIIFSVATLLVALPRTLDRFSWLGLLSVCVITAAGTVGMIGAGMNPVPGRTINVTSQTSFYQAFLAVTNPVSCLISIHPPH
jgi:hypothetical protein